MKQAQHITIIILFLFAPLFLYSSPIYVNVNSPCTADCDGSSWAMAYIDIQEALAVAEAGQEIWVAAGTYKPHPTDQTISYVLNEGIQLFGGFSGMETNIEQRDFNSNLTLLSGDLNNNDGPDFQNYEDNSYTIIFTREVSSATVVDGFTITGGNASAAGSPSAEHRNGGGWYNDIPWGTYGTSSPTIRNCIFDSNKAVFSGGGLFNSGSVGESYPYIFNCTFINNQASLGGGIYNEGNDGISNPEIVNCKFIGNVADQTGGGMYSFGLNGGDVTPSLTNTIFMNNSAYSAGGYYSLVIDGTSFSTITNCTFYGNYANIGGAVYLNSGATGFCEATISNSIFWGSDSVFDPHFHFSGEGLPKVYLSNSIMDTPDCESLLAGENQITCLGEGILFNEDPLFVNAEEGDFHIMEGSPAIDAGLNEAIESTGISVDIDGGERIVQSLVDLGVDEFTIITNTETLIDLPETVSLLTNPVKDKIELLNHKMPTKSYNYLLVSAVGQEVQNGSINFAGGNYAQILLEKEMAPGLYFLKLDNTIKAIKIIKL